MSTTNVTAAPARLAWSFAEASTMLGVSSNFLRREAQRGALPIRRVGRRVLIADQDLRDYLDGCSNGEQTPAEVA